MIGKFAVSGGNGWGRLCRYVMRERPGDLKRLERDGRTPDDARIVGGNMAGNSAYALSREFEFNAAMNPKVSEPIFHASLRLPEHESGRLSDRAWAEIGRDYTERMGFGDAAYLVVCHGQDHAHIVACRVDFQGRRVDQWRDRYRSRDLLREIERERGLDHPRERDRGRAPDTAREAERRDLRERIDRAIAAGDGSRAGFDRALAREGVRAEWKESNRDGRVVGVRFRSADAPEQDRGHKGSQLGGDYDGRALLDRIAVRDRAHDRQLARDRDDGFRRERTRGRTRGREDDAWAWCR